MKQETLPGMERTEKDLIDEGRRRRDEAIQRAREHAGDSWNDAARFCVLKTCQTNAEFTRDDVLRIAEGLRLPPPPDPRAWGGVMREAVSSGWCVKSGRWQASNRPECHRRPVPVYESRV